MSEYQRYEFMTVDQPLTRAQLAAVNKLSSHIEASATHAEIEYNWGDFKHDPIDVLYKFFDGFLYWANWGSPQFALRFPHGILPTNLLIRHDNDDMMVFSQHIAWLAAQYAQEEYDLRGSYHGLDDEDDDFDDEDYEDDEDDDEEPQEGARKTSPAGDTNEIDEDVIVPDVPPALGKLTAAQQTRVELLQLPQELLAAAARHSSAAAPALSVDDDNIVSWVEQLPSERRNDYLVRLARNEPDLHYRLLKELSKLNQNRSQTVSSTKQRVTFKQLQAESKAIKAEKARGFSW